MSMPPLDTAGPSSVPAAERGVDPTLGGASMVLLVDEVFDKKDTPASAPPPSWDEMMEILKRVWTRIFHVRPHSIGETRFLFICENLIF